jgi:transposase-like protein
MPISRKYDEETKARAVRMYEDHLRATGCSRLQARRHVGALLDVNPATLRGWVERRVDGSAASARVTTDVQEELKALRREVAELRRANEILRTASAFFAAAEVDRRLR